MYKIVKRILDFLVSLFAIVALSPVLAITAIAVKADSKGPVFFVQKRIGKDKKHFNMFKFRSMRTDTPHDMPTHLLNDPAQRTGGRRGMSKLTASESFVSPRIAFATRACEYSPRRVKTSLP